MQASPARVARNLVRQYGRAGLRRLVDAWQQGVSDTSLAAGYGVSHQRVQQWRTALGVRTSAWRPHADMARLAQEGDVLPEQEAAEAQPHP